MFTQLIVLQVAVLGQFLEEVDYTAVFKALQEKNTYDAMDSYYVCIWDISILEYLVRILIVENTVKYWSLLN